MIRGQNVSRALAILKFTDKRAADPIAKCLNSAIANATYSAEQQNIAIDPDGLWIKTCFVDMGPTKNRRRVRPAPQGRAYREQRHFCHVTILLSNDARPEPKAARHGDGKTAAIAAKPAKLAESKDRKRGGAAAAPRPKRVASKTAASEAAHKPEGEKKTTKRASKKKASKKDE